MSYISGSMSLAGTNSSTSISRLRSSGRVAMSSSVMIDRLAVVGFVGLGDVAVLDDLAAHLADALVADAPVVLGVHLVELDVVVLGGAVDLDRDVHQAEGDRTLPDGTHQPSMADCRPDSPHRVVARSGRSAPARATVSAADSAGRPHHGRQRVECRWRRRSRSAVGAQQVQRPQRVDQARHERVARAHGVHHVHSATQVPAPFPPRTSRTPRRSPIVTTTIDGPSASQSGRSVRASASGSIQCRSSSLALTTSARSRSRSMRARAASASSISAGRTLGSNVQRRREVIRVDQGRGGQASGFEHRGDRTGVDHQRRRDLRRAGQLPVDVEGVRAPSPSSSSVATRRRSARRVLAARNQLRT